MPNQLSHQEPAVLWTWSNMEHWDSLGFLVVTLNYNVTIIGEYFKTFVKPKYFALSFAAPILKLCKRPLDWTTGHWHWSSTLISSYPFVTFKEEVIIHMWFKSGQCISFLVKLTATSSLMDIFWASGKNSGIVFRFGFWCPSSTPAVGNVVWIVVKTHKNNSSLRREKASLLQEGICLWLITIVMLILFHFYKWVKFTCVKNKQKTNKQAQFFGSKQWAVFFFSSYLNKTPFLFHRLLGAKCESDTNFSGPFEAPSLPPQVGAAACAGCCRGNEDWAIRKGDAQRVLSKMNVILNCFLRSHWFFFFF